MIQQAIPQTLAESIENKNSTGFNKQRGQPKRLSRGLLYVMCYDLLMSGRGKLQGGGWLKRTLLEHEDELRNVLDKLLSQHSAQPGGRKRVGRPSKSELKLLIPEALRDQAALPRYARINVLKGTMAAAVAELRQGGWKVIAAPEWAPSGRTEAPTKEAAARMQLGPPPKEVWLDAHVPTLLAFPHGTDLHDHSMVTSGRLLLQVFYCPHFGVFA